MAGRAARRRKSWSEPTRQIVLLAVVAAICFSSISLFHSLTVSETNNSKNDHNYWYCGYEGIPTRMTVDKVQGLRHAMNRSPETLIHDNPASLAPSLAISSVDPNANTFAKAYDQSYGLVTDIPQATWELWRERAHAARSRLPSAANEDPAAALARIDNPVLSYLLDIQPDFTCPHPVRLDATHSVSGNNADNGQEHGGTVSPTWVCNVHRLAERPACLIYSFGSSLSLTAENKWHDGLLQELNDNNNSSTACEIHFFDEGNTARRDNVGGGVDSLQVHNIHYHSNWALKSSYHDHFNAEQTRSARRLNREPAAAWTFQETRRILGHENRTIDVLLVDCHVTRCEWATYKDWVSADARQILVSTHGPPFSRGTTVDSGKLRFLASDFFHAFTANKYAMFSKEARDGGFDFGFVKLHPDFWESGNGVDFSQVRQLYLPTVDIPGPKTAVSPRIPRRIVYVNDGNLLDLEYPVESYFTTWRTIEKYRTAWNMSEVDVWFVDEYTCLAALLQEKPELLWFFRAETNEHRKTDICKAVAMYVSGGFYFDVDFEVRSFSDKPTDGTELMLATEDDGRLSRRFMACEAKSSVLKLALDNILEAYKQNMTGHVEFELGTEALAGSVRAHGSSVQIEYVVREWLGGNATVPWIAPVPLAGYFVNAIPTDMRGPPSTDHKIPHRLIFTYTHNILETKEPAVLYTNVQKTIGLYRKAWGEPTAPVWFMNDTDCQSAIYAAKPGLVTYFDREPKGSWKADICRVAALYLTGGYYFDVDMETVNPWIPDGNVSFVTAIEETKTMYFQSFLATTRHSPILARALDEMLLYYENRILRTDSLLGPETLKWAVDSLPQSEQDGEMIVLEEISFNVSESKPLRREAVGTSCHFKVVTPGTTNILFYSRAVDANYKCVSRDSPEGQAFLLKGF